jgi:hypothetical protein
MHYLRKYASNIEDLSTEVHRFDAARAVHERLSEALGDIKRTFFDNRPPIEEVKEGELPIFLQENEQPPLLTSLDIMAYAYLKEELINTTKSPIVAHLKQAFPNLIRFVAYIDNYLAKPAD